MINYGYFQLYTPAFDSTIPEENPFRLAKYFRNEAGTDFYALTHTSLDPAFAAILGTSPVTVTAGMTYLLVNQSGRIRVASNDIQSLFPSNCSVVAIDLVSDPATLSNKIIDLSTGAISDPPVAPILGVSAAQAKNALYNAGLYDQVVAAVNASAVPVQIWFNNAPNWDRQNPYILAIGTQLGLSSDQIDALFTQAASL